MDDKITMIKKFDIPKPNNSNIISIDSVDGKQGLNEFLGVDLNKVKVKYPNYLIGKNDVIGRAEKCQSLFRALLDNIYGKENNREICVRDSAMYIDVFYICDNFTIDNKDNMDIFTSMIDLSDEFDIYESDDGRLNISFIFADPYDFKY